MLLPLPALLKTMKSNKSFLKRIRLTRTGKLISRMPGQNHFNAKDSGRSRQRKHRANSTVMTKKDQSRYMSA